MNRPDDPLPRSTASLRLHFHNGERLIAVFRAAERRTADAVALQLRELDEALNPQPAVPAQRQDADVG